MKKCCKILFLSLLLAAAFTVTAHASSYDGAAEELKALGLFRGTDEGFELDRAPTRTEAAVMLVRLLGAEEEAFAQYDGAAVSHPFADVDAWADPYVAWLYENGLANGVSGTEYGAADACSAQMFCTFLLRSLGYSDAEGGDFTYAEALSYAEGLALYDPAAVGGGAFLRDHTAALSYQAMATGVNGSERTLLQTLVDDGAVDAAAAQPLLDKIDAYRSYISVCAAWEDISAFDMTMEIAFDMTVPGEEGSISATSDSSIKMMIDGDDIRMEAVMDVDDGDGSVTTIREWMKDGYLYMTDGTDKMKIQMDYGLMLEQLGEQTKQTSLPSDSLYGFETISAEQTENGTVYGFAYSSGISDMINELIKNFDTAMISNMRIADMQYEILVDNDGMISEIRMVFSFSADVGVEGEIYPLVYDYDMLCTINAVGGDVEITFPDFSDYADYTGLIQE